MILNKDDVIEAAKQIFLIDTDRRIYFKVVDYSDNPMAPEQIAYKFYFWDITGQREKFMYYPNTVGFQGLR